MGSLESDYNLPSGQVFALISIVGPECPQKNDKFGVKIRGVFPTADEAKSFAKRLQKDDATFDIYVVEMGKWLLIPPDRDKIEDTHYVNDKLEEIMQGYRDNQRQAAAMFEKRKRDMMAKPVEGDAPYIDPADENSKYYTKPDVPPVPHPADFLDELRAEFPDRPEEDIRHLADIKVLDIIAERRVAREKELAEAEEKFKREQENKEPIKEEADEVAV
ncbi:hypothetical protein EBT31_02805 [bacterium]|nr:hypothetical protein [bacterium]